MPKRYSFCKFTIAEEQNIIACYESGLGTELTARRFRTTQSLVMRILRAYGVVRRPNRKYPFNERFFSAIDTEAKAYLLGLLTADGYIHEGPKRWVVQLFVTDRELCDILREAVNGPQPIYTVDLAKWNGKPGYMLALCSKLMVQDLMALGVRQAKSKTATFCGEVPNIYLRHYIRGLSDGDGSLGIYQGRLAWSLLGTENLLRGCLNIFSEHLGIKPKKPKPHCGTFFIGYHGLGAFAITNWLYNSAHFYLSRKQAILAEYQKSHAQMMPPEILGSN